MFTIFSPEGSDIYLIFDINSPRPCCEHLVLDVTIMRQAKSARFCSPTKRENPGTRKSTSKVRKSRVKSACSKWPCKSFQSQARSWKHAHEQTNLQPTTRLISSISTHFHHQYHAASRTTHLRNKEIHDTAAIDLYWCPLLLLGISTSRFVRWLKAYNEQLEILIIISLTFLRVKFKDVVVVVRWPWGQSPAGAR